MNDVTIDQQNQVIESYDGVFDVQEYYLAEI